MRASSSARGMKSRSKLWIAAHASATDVTGTIAPMRAITSSHNSCTTGNRCSRGNDSMPGCRASHGSMRIGRPTVTAARP